MIVLFIGGSNLPQNMKEIISAQKNKEDRFFTFISWGYEKYAVSQVKKYFKVDHKDLEDDSKELSDSADKVLKHV